MSSFTVTNTTNGKTNTLANTLTANNFGQTIPGYKQAGVAIPAGLIANVAIEATNTGYKTSGTDLGITYCAKYIEYLSAGGSAGSINVSNYSSCTIVMCGGGGGGGGGGIGPAIIASPGNGGGAGGINIIQKIPLGGVSSINYSVGNGGTGGAGARAPGNGTDGRPGNSTQVSISSTSYIANGGSGGIVGGSNPGVPGTITPATQNFTTATLNGGLAGGTVTYDSNTNRAIQVVGTNYGQGGSGGNKRPIGPSANPGNNGSPGYLRVYLYP